LPSSKPKGKAINGGGTNGVITPIEDEELELLDDRLLDKLLETELKLEDTLELIELELKLEERLKLEELKLLETELELIDEEGTDTEEKLKLGLELVDETEETLARGILIEEPAKTTEDATGVPIIIELEP
jgi:hypothetical protein